MWKGNPNKNQDYNDRGNKKPKFPKQKQMSREASQQVIITVPLKKMSQATILRQSILDDVVLNIKYR